MSYDPKAARVKNHPNVVACGHPNPNDSRSKDLKKERPKDNRLFKAKAEEINKDKDDGDNQNERYCSFHERKLGQLRHELGECKAYSKKTLEERPIGLRKPVSVFGAWSRNAERSNARRTTSNNIT